VYDGWNDWLTSNHWASRSEALGTLGAGGDTPHDGVAAIIPSASDAIVGRTLEGDPCPHRTKGHAPRGGPKVSDAKPRSPLDVNGDDCRPGGAVDVLRGAGPCVLYRRVVSLRSDCPIDRRSDRVPPTGGRVRPPGHVDPGTVGQISPGDHSDAAPVAVAGRLVRGDPEDLRFRALAPGGGSRGRGPALQRPFQPPSRVKCRYCG